MTNARSAAKDHYGVLGVLPTAEAVVIAAAYRELAKKYHPDKWRGERSIGEARMRELNAAYEVLSTELRRREYDRDCGKAPDPTPNDASARSASQDAEQARQETTKKGAGADGGIMRAFPIGASVVIAIGASWVFWAIASNSQVSEKTEPTQASASQKQTLVPRGSEKPSFDCAKAKTAPARLICADGELARLDGELGVAFQEKKAQISATDQSKFVAEQRAWIDTRNTRCELDGKNRAAIEVLASSKPCMVSVI